MSYGLTVVPQHRYGLIAYEGSVDGRQIIEAGYALLEDPRWEPGFAEVLDGSRASGLHVTPAHLATLVKQERHTAARLGDSTQIVITRLEVARVVLRLFQAMTRAQGREAHLCTSRDEAAALLGVGALADPLAGG